jgi:hypothetical protein
VGHDQRQRVLVLRADMQEGGVPTSMKRDYLGEKWGSDEFLLHVARRGLLHFDVGNNDQSVRFCQ